MRGAVLSRLQQLYDECSPTTAFIARSSFGIVLDVPYISYKHEYGPNYEHTITGEKMVKDQVEWLVKKVRYDRQLPEQIPEFVFVNEVIGRYNRETRLSSIRVTKENLFAMSCSLKAIGKSGLTNLSDAT